MGGGGGFSCSTEVSESDQVPREITRYGMTSESIRTSLIFLHIKVK